MGCDMCGKDARLFIAEIEGTRLQVCSSCAGFGKVIREASVQKPIFVDRKKAAPKVDVVQMIVSDYASKIKGIREKLGLKQEEFAKRINEKESRIHQMESGKHEPSIDLARKLERAFGIKLIEEFDSKDLPKFTKEKGDGLTLGDLIKLK